MIKNEKLTIEAAKYKTEAKSRFDNALAALLSLAWEHKSMGDSFSFQADPAMYERALEICRELSEQCMKDAEAIVRTIFDEEIEMDSDAADKALESFDMAGSHLLQLLDAWVVVAFSNGYSMAYTSISVVRYMNNPFASGMFGAWGKDVMKWGRGYERNIINQLAVIGQNLVIDVVRLEEWKRESKNGATYYIRRRGSSFDCPTCDEQCGTRIPISVPFVRTHSRCCCWPEYHYEKI